MRDRLALIILIIATVVGAHRSATALEPARIAPPPGATLVRDPASGAILVGSGQSWQPLEWRDGALQLGAPRAAPPIDRMPDRALPHSAVARGMHIRRAWLSEPTDRYGHGVLGDRLEAAALVAELNDGTSIAHRLEDDEVFEDLAPRIVTVGGEELILVVRSSLRSGAAAALYRIGAGALVEVAAATPIGAPNRWLNPVGAADLDGDGAIEILVVETPHLRGILKAFSVREGKLVETARLEGVSNHDLGSTELRLHAIADFDGDGRDDVAVRAKDGRSVLLVGWRDGTLHEFARTTHDLRIVGPIFAAGFDASRAGLVYRLADGSLAALRF